MTILGMYRYINIINKEWYIYHKKTWGKMIRLKDRYIYINDIRI